MKETADAPVICKGDPISQGWKPRGNRTWEMPDGRLFTFAPGAKEEVVVYIAVQYPKRIQRKRTRGWKMPEGAVYVGRPAKWGNPFKIGDGMTPMAALTFYKLWLSGKKGTGGGGLRRLAVIAGIPELRGKDLACWCPLVDKDGNRFPCHADILLAIANSETKP